MGLLVVDVFAALALCVLAVSFCRSGNARGFLVGLLVVLVVLLWAFVAAVSR